MRFVLCNFVLKQVVEQLCQSWSHFRVAYFTKKEHGGIYGVLCTRCECVANICIGIVWLEGQLFRNRLLSCSIPVWVKP